MARYTVHVPANSNVQAEALERAVFVRDGWNWGAFAFGPLWLLWNRHWITGLMMLAAYGAILVGISVLPTQDGVKSAAWLLLAVLWGFEGSSLRRLALNRTGHTEAGLVVGSDLDTLERRFFAERAVAAPALSPSTTNPTISTLPVGGMKPVSPDVLGLFPDSRKSS